MITGLFVAVGAVALLLAGAVDDHRKRAANRNTSKERT